MRRAGRMTATRSTGPRLDRSRAGGGSGSAHLELARGSLDRRCRSAHAGMLAALSARVACVLQQDPGCCSVSARRVSVDSEHARRPVGAGTGRACTSALRSTATTRNPGERAPERRRSAARPRPPRSRPRSRAPTTAISCTVGRLPRRLLETGQVRAPERPAHERRDDDRARAVRRARAARPRRASRCGRSARRAPARARSRERSARARPPAASPSRLAAYPAATQTAPGTTATIVFRADQVVGARRARARPGGRRGGGELPATSAPRRARRTTRTSSASPTRRSAAATTLPATSAGKL